MDHEVDRARITGQHEVISRQGIAFGLPTNLDPADCGHAGKVLRHSRVSEYELERQLGRVRAADLVERIEGASLAASEGEPSFLNQLGDTLQLEQVKRA